MRAISSAAATNPSAKYRPLWAILRIYARSSSKVVRKCLCTRTPPILGARPKPKSLCSNLKEMWFPRARKKTFGCFRLHLFIECDSRVHAKKLPISTAPTGLRVYICPQVREKLYIKFPKRQVWQFFKCARCARKFRLPGYPYLVMIISFFRNRAKNLKCRNMLY